MHSAKRIVHSGLVHLVYRVCLVCLVIGDLGSKKINQLRSHREVALTR
jgi:hypothetical protein